MKRVRTAAEVFLLKRYAMGVTTRLMILFLALLLPVVLFGAEIIRRSTDDLHTKVIDLAHQGLDNTRVMMEKEALSIQSELFLLTDSSSDNDIMNFFGYYSYYTRSKYYLTVRRILTKLSSLKTRHDLIREVEVYYIRYGQSVSSRRGLRSRPAAEYEDYRQNALSNVLNYSAARNEFYLMQSVPAKNPQILLIAHLDDDHLKAMLFSEPYGDQPTVLNHRKGAFALKNTDPFDTDALSRQPYETITVHSDILNGDLCKYLMTNEIFHEENLRLRLLFFYILLCVPIAAVCFLGVRRSIGIPVKRMVNAMRVMREGDLKYRIDRKPASREFRLLTDGLNSMMDQIDSLIDSNYKYEIYARKLELKHLQAQINPHFLYNTLYMLRHMIADEDIDSASVLCQHLGDYFKYMSSTGEMELPLEKEYAHARNYLAIQAMRFGLKLRAEQEELPEEWAEMIVPRLILQPIYENAVSYAQRSEGCLLVRTAFLTSPDCLTIRIEDSGTNLSDEKLSELRARVSDADADGNVTALHSIHRRLSLFYGQNARLSLSRSSLGGLCVELNIPRFGGSQHE